MKYLFFKTLVFPGTNNIVECVGERTDSYGLVERWLISMLRFLVLLIIMIIFGLYTGFLLIIEGMFGENSEFLCSSRERYKNMQ
ncbi:hypothetical protein MNB_SV-10-1116 [hydrothermal vent metagenome]|uniref:Uncharacterized protein n=1 Tax=hydrothermal vent metagenome TaxID=652676 RepID=A0A1W1CUZ9_9ZZZZ